MAAAAPADRQYARKRGSACGEMSRRFRGNRQPLRARQRASRECVMLRPHECSNDSRRDDSDFRSSTDSSTATTRAVFCAGCPQPSIVSRVSGSSGFPVYHSGIEIVGYRLDNAPIAWLNLRASAARSAFRCPNRTASASMYAFSCSELAKASDRAFVRAS